MPLTDDAPPTFKALRWSTTGCRWGLWATVDGNRRWTKNDKGNSTGDCGASWTRGRLLDIFELSATRRTWLCGFEKIGNRYLIAALARNLSVLPRELFG